MIRNKTKVEGTAAQDFCYSCCCNALALAQEARHLDAKAYKVVSHSLVSRTMRFL